MGLKSGLRHLNPEPIWDLSPRSHILNLRQRALGVDLSNTKLAKAQSRRLIGLGFMCLKVLSTHGCQSNRKCNRLRRPFFNMGFLQNCPACDKPLCDKAFVEQTCSKLLCQRSATSGRDKGACNKGLGVALRQNRILIHILIGLFRYPHPLPPQIVTKPRN